MSVTEPSYATSGYVHKGYQPHEALNFLPDGNGKFWGYMPMVDTPSDEYGNVSINRLGATNADDFIDGVDVVFIAPRPSDHKLLIVGHYFDATVWREPTERKDKQDVVGSIIYISSQNAKLIPEDERFFEIPRSRGVKDAGIGQSNVWYGLHELEKFSELKQAVLEYCANPELENAPADQESVIEAKKRAAHGKLERKGSYRHFISEKGYKCEACDWTIKRKHIPIWGSVFELHHLTPFSDLKEGEKRKVTADDFAVLCTACHRAIHKVESGKFVSDVKSFSEKYKNPIRRKDQ